MAMVLQAMLLSKVLTLARYLHIITPSLLTIGKLDTMGEEFNSPTTIMKRKTNRKQQSPRDIRKQIIEDLKKESDEMKRELLRQRLHHYNTLIKN